MKSLILGFESGRADIDEYCDMLQELLKFLKHFGSGIAKAFNDTTEKINAVRGNRTVLIDQLKFCEKGTDAEKYI